MAKKILVSVLLSLLSCAAAAVQLEVAVGQTEWQKSNATDWWQEGPASEGFYNTFNLKSTSYRVGVAGYVSTSVRYRAGYANLGSVSSRAGATNFDSQYDMVNKRCVDPSSCEIVDYVGGGSADGYYFTLAPEYRAGSWALFGELGLWAYFPKFSMSKFHKSGQVDRLDINSAMQVGPVAGVGARYGDLSVVFRMYHTNYSGQMDSGSNMPAIYQGYASELSVGWEF